MKVWYISKLFFESFKPSKNVSVISIRDPGEVVSNLAGWEKVLSIECHDIDCAVEGFKLFSNDQAAQIIDFIKDSNFILIHCHAGVSRSGAVAKFISELGYELFTFPESDNSCYNKHIYSVLTEVKKGAFNV